MNSVSSISVTKDNWKLKPFDINSHKYTVRLAQNREELESALRLRFQVFNIELGEGLASSYENKMDEDEFDEQCDHLLVIEKATEKVIGTYRMQNNDMAAKGNGFYTSAEFNISEFPNRVLSSAVELGRACVHKDHRSGRVLYLLWRGLAKYMVNSEKRYLFGCCSLTSQDPNEGKATYQFLNNNEYLHPEYNISVEPEFECLSQADANTGKGEVDIPQLFRLYLDLGTLVCSPPALDRTFKTIDFLILLDIQGLSEQTKTLFFR